jgi:sialidase-1
MRTEPNIWGAGDLSPHSICLANSKDGGRTWENVRIVVRPDKDYRNVNSPNFLRLKNGRLRLFYYQFQFIKCEGGLRRVQDAFYIDSPDEGGSFSAPVLVWKDKERSNRAGCITRLCSGRVLFPVEELEGAWNNEEKIKLAVLYSDDDSNTWKEGQILKLPMRGAMEGIIAQMAGGDLMMVMRTQLGSVFKSYSGDDGLTWSKPQTTGLKAPESCPCVSAVPGTDKLLVIWNNSEYDMDWPSHYGRRSPLTAAITQNGGATFTHFWNIETDPTSLFSNPQITWTRDGFCLLTYFTKKYLDDGRMMDKGFMSIKLARFRIDTNQGD